MRYYVHEVPGRLRVKIPGIKGRKNQIEKVRQLLDQPDGIESVSANEVTGSIVIHYDSSAIGSPEILRILKDHNYFDETRAMMEKHAGHDPASQAVERFGKAIFGWALGKALEGSGLSFLAALV
jgi:hypothetical protein